MFKDAKAFSSFSTDDIAAARKFYGETLGLDLTEETAMGLLHLNLATGGEVLIYPKGKVHKPADYTVLNFPVDNIISAVDALTAKGVKFEHYDEEMIKTDDKGIANQGPISMAWFKDPAGNILSLVEEKK